MPAVSIVDLHVRFGDTVAVDRVSFEADHGSVTTVIGRNGAGKTTTMETAQGYHRPGRGTVRVLGMDPAADRRRLNPLIGSLLQEGGVYPAMRAGDAVRLFARYHSDPLDPDRLLDRVGLGAVSATPYRRLSGGEQRRLALALALVGRPRVVFLDEPTSGVDADGRGLIRQVVAELRADGVCVVLSTHELDEAERMADRIVVIDQGRVVAAAPLDELVMGQGLDVSFTSSGPVDRARVAQIIGCPVVEDADGRFRAARPLRDAEVSRFLAAIPELGIDPASLRVSQRTLEDVFLALTAAGRAG